MTPDSIEYTNLSEAVKLFLDEPDNRNIPAYGLLEDAEKALNSIAEAWPEIGYCSSCDKYEEGWDEALSRAEHAMHLLQDRIEAWGKAHLDDQLTEEFLELIEECAEKFGKLVVARNIMIKKWA